MNLDEALAVYLYARILPPGGAAEPKTSKAMSEAWSVIRKYAMEAIEKVPHEQDKDEPPQAWLEAKKEVDEGWPS